MSDFLIVVATMAGLAYTAWFVYCNDGEGNTRPDKTLMAMVEDKNPARRRWFGMPGPRDRRN
ncbi:MAG: hypothetical protein IT563_12580 [Alphaproteobacteria bacterium]|nr:hypothetical protein [Alphaproteobacteria bacterium]